MIDVTKDPWRIFDDNIVMLSGPDEGTGGTLQFASVGTRPDAQDMVNCWLYEIQASWVSYSTHFLNEPLFGQSLWVEDLVITGDVVTLAVDRFSDDEISFAFRFDVARPGRWAVIRTKSGRVEEEFPTADFLASCFSDAGLSWNSIAL